MPPTDVIKPEIYASINATSPPSTPSPQHSEIASRAIVAALGVNGKGEMAPITRSEGVPTAIVGIPLNPPVMKRALREADILIPVVAPSSSRKLTRLHALVTSPSTVEATSAAYKAVTGLWSDTLSAASNLDNALRRVNTLIDCGDWIYDYIRPYVDEVKCLYPWIRNTEQFIRVWEARGGVVNGASTETRLIRRMIVRVNPSFQAPNMQPRIGQELIKVYNLMIVYIDRCTRCHNSTATLSEQEYWDWLKSTEQNCNNNVYTFARPTDHLYVIRAIQRKRELHYQWVNGQLEYIDNFGVPTGIFVNPWYSLHF